MITHVAVGFLTCVLGFYISEASHLKGSLKGLHSNSGVPSPFQHNAKTVLHCQKFLYVSVAKTPTPEDYIKILPWGPGVEMGLCSESCLGIFALLILSWLENGAKVSRLWFCSQYGPFT